MPNFKSSLLAGIAVISSLTASAQSSTPLNSSNIESRTQMSYNEMSKNPEISSAFYSKLTDYVLRNEHLYQSPQNIDNLGESRTRKIIDSNSIENRTHSPNRIIRSIESLTEKIEREVKRDSKLPTDKHMKAVLYSQDTGYRNIEPEDQKNYDAFKKYLENLTVDELDGLWKKVGIKGSEEVDIGKDKSIRVSYTLATRDEMQKDGLKLTDYDLQLGSVNLELKDRKRGLVLGGEVGYTGSSASIKKIITDYEILRVKRQNGKSIYILTTPDKFPLVLEAKVKTDYEENTWGLGIISGSLFKPQLPHEKKRKTDFLGGFGIRGRFDGKPELCLDFNVSW